MIFYFQIFTWRKIKRTVKQRPKYSLYSKTIKILPYLLHLSPYICIDACTNMHLIYVYINVSWTVWNQVSTSWSLTPNSLSMHLSSSRTFSPLITAAIIQFRKMNYINTILLSNHNPYSKFTNIISEFKHLQQLSVGGT